MLVLSQTAILIRWNLPDLLERNGPIVGYQIVLIYTNGSSSVYNSPHGDLLSLQIEGMRSETVLFVYAQDLMCFIIGIFVQA